MREGHVVDRHEMLETYKEFSFDAAHQNPPHTGLHGHTFKVRLTLRGTPDPVFGWTHNLYEVDPVVMQVRAELDHRFLNEIEGLQVATLENIARYIWRRLDSRLDGLAGVEVRRGVDGYVEGARFSLEAAAAPRAMRAEAVAA